MQVHIRRTNEGTYLAANGEWVKKVKSARAFSNAKEAVEYCRAEKLKGVELLILRPSAPPLIMPLSARSISG
jgi:hypothetical protein